MAEAWRGYGVLRFRDGEGRARALSSAMRCVGMFVRGEPLRTVDPALRTSLHVSNLDFGMSVREVADVMTDMHAYAEVPGLEIRCSHESEAPPGAAGGVGVSGGSDENTGHCLIAYPHYSHAIAALSQMKGAEVRGRPLKLAWLSNR
jgi:hypothetical protein